MIKKTDNLNSARLLEKDKYYRGKHLQYSLLLLAFVLLGGAMGYVLIEGWSFVDSLYMTVITIATVGYSEVQPLSEPGRLFTIIVILLGVGTAGYSLGSLTQLLVSIQLADTFGRRKLEKEISKLKNHYIVCGYGRMGQIVCEELIAKGAIREPFLILTQADGKWQRIIQRKFNQDKPDRVFLDFEEEDDDCPF